jgi:hypothetical protein
MIDVIAGQKLKNLLGPVLTFSRQSLRKIQANFCISILDDLLAKLLCRSARIMGQGVGPGNPHRHMVGVNHTLEMIEKNSLTKAPQGDQNIATYPGYGVGKQGSQPGEDLFPPPHDIHCLHGIGTNPPIHVSQEGAHPRNVLSPSKHRKNGKQTGNNFGFQILSLQQGDHLVVGLRRSLTLDSHQDLDQLARSQPNKVRHRWRLDLSWNGI